LHTGLRPFSELTKLTADEVEETPREMMWRVYATKTTKTRKVPVRPEVAKLTRRPLKTAPRGGRPAPVSDGHRAGVDQGAWGDPVRKRYSTYSCPHTFAHRMLRGY
jgi:integrase